jgi:thioredoxin-dependent peroxiredoxin
MSRNDKGPPREAQGGAGESLREESYRLICPKEEYMNKSLFTGILAGAIMIMNSMAGELKTGDPAPDFNLKGSDGKTYKLSDFKGKQPVVVAWFPKAFTPGCTIECKTMKEQGEKLKAYDVAYFTASVDDAETNRKFAESLNLDYPILSDPTKETAKAYGVLKPEGNYANRWTFFIDKDGKIAHVDKAVKPAEHADAISNQLKEMKVTRK